MADDLFTLNTVSVERQDDDDDDEDAEEANNNINNDEIAEDEAPDHEQEEADACRQQRTPPRSNKIIISVECKFLRVEERRDSGACKGIYKGSSRSRDCRFWKAIVSGNL